jgi:hypothetical protein
MRFRRAELPAPKLVGHVETAKAELCFSRFIHRNDLYSFSAFAPERHLYTRPTHPDVRREWKTRAEESAQILERMTADVTETKPSRVYLVAANHGQLLEKLKAAPQTEPLKAMMRAIEGLLVTGINPDPSIRLTALLGRT